jgi:DNA-binding transcriptional LysR family regulator
LYRVDSEDAETRCTANAPVDLDALATFVTLVECGSLTETAERMYCAVSTVSQKLSRLERWCGVRLWNRREGNGTPTAEGWQVLPMARTVLSASQEIRRLCSYLQLPSRLDPVRMNVRIHDR